jgi:hypothetical protein
VGFADEHFETFGRGHPRLLPRGHYAQAGAQGQDALKDSSGHERRACPGSGQYRIRPGRESTWETAGQTSKPSDAGAGVPARLARC